jgi:hypothetical protein
LVYSGGIPAVPRNVKLSEFRSEPFRGREKCSEFSTVEQKLKQNSWNIVPTIPRKRKQLGIPFRVDKKLLRGKRGERGEGRGG